MKTHALKRRITVALLSALSFLIMLISFPLPVFPVFLTLDFSDLPAIIGAILFGPLAGIAIEGLKNILHYLIVGSFTGVPVGEAANFLAGSFYILGGAWIYKKSRSTKSLFTGLLFGTVLMTLLMGVLNYYVIFPAYAMFMGFSIDNAVAVAQGANHQIHSLFTLIVFAILPFNLLKGMIMTLIAVPVYNRLKGYFRNYAV
jgi:riboflavin transporter FmnP